MLEKWHIGDVGCWGCEMLGMWDVGDVGYLGCGMFKIGMFGIWDVECGMFAAMWNVDLQNSIFLLKPVLSVRLSNSL